MQSRLSCFLSFICIVGFSLGGCVLAPSKTSESDLSVIDRAYQFEKGSRPIKITADTVVLDVRTFFDYQISRLPNAIHIDHKEFSLRKLRGEDLQDRALKLARRLALLGVTPFSHVVVLGYGDRGNGEEGTVALSLLVLGVERIQMGSMRDFKFLATAKVSKALQNQRYWEPRVVGAILCPAHAGEDAVFVIDVSKKAPMSSGGGWQKIAIIYKNWKEFVKKEDFSPNYGIKTALQKDEIDSFARVMIRGPQAPIVVFSMLQMGYSRVCMMDE
jgi:rhodanese-related sulfurtransferase